MFNMAYVSKTRPCVYAFLLFSCTLTFLALDSAGSMCMYKPFLTMFDSLWRHFQFAVLLSEETRSHCRYCLISSIVLWRHLLSAMQLLFFFFLNFPSWMCFLQMYCGKINKQYWDSRIRYSVHTIYPYRVFGVLSTSKHFQDAFSCSDSSRMVAKSCPIW